MARSTTQPRRYAYDPGEEPKRRHAWSKDHAGFVKQRGVLVGKCPRGISLATAEELLNKGIALPSTRADEPWPSRIYVVHEGVVYRAVPTHGGKSYHAFPELGVQLRKLPRAFRAKLLDRARELGCEAQVKQWIRRNN